MSNEQLELDIEKTPFTLAPKNEILRYNLAKCVKDLYEENYKTLRKEIK